MVHKMAKVEELFQMFPDWLLMPGIFISCLLVVLLLRLLTLRALNRMSVSLSRSLAQHIVQALRAPLTLIAAVIALQISQAISALAGIDVASYADFSAMLCRILLVFALLLFIDRLSAALVAEYKQTAILHNSHGLVKGFIRLLVFVLGTLIIFSTLGVSITPILASLGISSLAVALALQPTLENFFSGLQLVADKPIRVGDYIELESGEQGFVEKIGWRSTWIRMLPNNYIIMPNSVLAQSKIINYYYPQKELSVPVEVSVHYNSDLDHVERVTLEVARAVLISHKWGIDDYETFVVFHTFDSSSINFTVMLRAQEYFNRFFLKSEFIKQLHKRFAQEGIVIPYPIRAINTTQEGARASVDSPLKS